MTFFGIEIFNWLMLFAILTGPIAAVQIQKKIESFRDRHARQMHIFRTLMATRATPVHYEHVQALNLIDLDFSEKRKKEKAVVRAWRALLDQFGKFPQIESFEGRQDEFRIQQNLANEKAQTLLVNLLLAMSEALGYDFESIHISNGCYVPTGHTDLENDQRLLRKGVLELLAGNLPVNMNVLSLPEQTPHDDIKSVFDSSISKQEQILGILQSFADGTSALRMEVSDFTDKRKNIVQKTGNDN